VAKPFSNSLGLELRAAAAAAAPATREAAKLATWERKMTRTVERDRLATEKRRTARELAAAAKRTARELATVAATAKKDALRAKRVAVVAHSRAYPGFGPGKKKR
jgi:hypothetical protein